MRKASFSLLAAAVVAVLFLSSCGSDSSTTQAPPPTSGLTKRVFLASSLTGITLIIDASRDELSAFRIGTTGRPTIMRSVPAQRLTLVYDEAANRLQYVDIATESVVTDRATVVLSGTTESLVMQSDARVAYAAIRNLSRIDKVDIITGAITGITGIPQVRRLVLSPNNAKLLAFSDDSNDVRIVNTADNTIVTVSGFDRAYTAVFADNNRAFVLSCGAECGGTQSKVSVLDLTTNTITGEVNVEGATVGLLDGATLYVAGNRVDPGNVLVPRLNVVNTGNLTATQPAVTVHSGLHTLMALGANNRLFIGGSGCVGSCLTIFNTSAQSATQSVQQGPVTSILPITGRPVVYVVENGDLKIYDTNTDSLQAVQIDITGAVSVMNEVD